MAPTSAKRRITTWLLVRSLWRYRGRIAAHGDRYQAEIATAVSTALDARLLGRAALGTYRTLMWVLVGLAVAFGVLALVLGTILFQVSHGAALFALLPLAGLIWMLVLRFGWGAPLDWLDEHNDPARRVSIGELPSNLRVIAQELRALTDVPANVSAELDALADDVEAANGPHRVD